VDGAIREDVITVADLTGDYRIVFEANRG